jgi:ABC-2 type transport system permease protein
MSGAQAWRAFLAQAKAELLLSTRRGENLLVTLAIPLLLLVFFSSVPLLPPPAWGGKQVDQVVPGILALAIVSTGLVSLGIATAFERAYGVLKRLGGSPLPRWALLAAKTVAVLATEVVQVALVVLVGALLGWAPRGGIGESMVASLPWLLLGSLAFCAMGLLLAGILRAEAVLAVANGLYLVFLLLGGIIIPLDHLPAAVAFPASLLPPAQLAGLLRGTFEPGTAVDPLQAAGLAAWAVALVAATLLTFRTE